MSQLDKGEAKEVSSHTTDTTTKPQTQSLAIPPAANTGAQKKLPYLRHVERERPSAVAVPSTTAPPALPLREITDASTRAPPEAERPNASLPLFSPIAPAEAQETDNMKDEVEEGTDSTRSTQSVVSRLEWLTARLSTLEAEKQALLADILERNAPLQAELAALEEEREALSSSQARLQEAINAAVAKRQTLQSRLQTLEETYAERFETAQRAMLHSSRLRKQLRRLESDRDAAKAKHKATIAAHRESGLAQHAQERALAALQTQRANLVDEVDQRRIALAERREELHRAQEGITQLRAARRGAPKAADAEDSDTSATTLTAVTSAGVDDTGMATSTSAVTGKLDENSALREQLRTLGSLCERVQAVLSTRGYARPQQREDTAYSAVDETLQRLEANAGLCSRAEEITHALAQWADTESRVLKQIQ